ncbi:glutamate-5-semialdehyde dehydrogenase [Leptospira bandrabouensis]|uniref:Gamma-glutamyl phosphate reductase n=1 Tax=Leptospira soteropolitanensis TaxID=2950025 RepID=A0AAW5VC90_9LEPT|nr:MULTISPECIES: glutamate-5-semialdehyde dehydrogenase [Leptospira]MCG6144688.1 glutamate-5-semialdehyde dehydrogenase [Leptospira bandrabouensis]MCG6161680.1 glutamate-5-semialdehyde dehydrogenase [Leptospira bandrabouensis]MCG6164607.1 glutamate-5-semialdehyde dehydrogenase [Leptospira bandrabouensis]MCW7459402.1 glutamate-5-semialdehyde dehydrogenase [Leptospira bandrabouensis]MCW7477931.1 glutamate-5-semialdehyde dehydrogenase [Leptospira bandrabouensis]
MADENTNYARSLATKAKLASRGLKGLTTLEKNSVLKRVEELLFENESAIIEKNKIDMKNGQEKGLSSAMMDRLLLDSKRIKNMAKSIEEIRNLPDPVGEVVRGTILPNGLELLTKRVPIGVVMTIFESRPNVIIDIASLSFKSGNACILRGGSEAFHSNLILSSLFHQAIEEKKLPAVTKEVVTFVENTNREAMVPFFQLDDLIDVIVPRGGEALIRFVSENSKIPVIKHDKGVTNLYLSHQANPKIVLPILLNSKVQRPGVCNALENLLIHKDYPNIKNLLESLATNGVQILGDESITKIFPSAKPATEDDFYTEFLDTRLSVKLVGSVWEAMENIRKYSSGHTECILSEDITEIQTFQKELDSAAIFVNCSTRFHDGGEYGLGAEVGISTGKLHVRGPMGLIHLTTTTTYVTGSGQVRT